MYELEMNGQMVPFNFGMGFLREINKKVSVPVEGMPGVKRDIGLRYSVSKLLDGDTEALVEVLDTANKGCDPRITRNLLDQFVDDADTDIDEVFEKVLGFLKKANATRKAALAVQEAVEKEREKQEAMEKMRMEAMA